MKTLKFLSVLFFLLCLLSSCTKKQEQNSFSSEASASPEIAIQEQQEEIAEKPAEKTLSAESVEHESAKPIEEESVEVESVEVESVEVESVEIVAPVEEITTVLQTEEPVEIVEIGDIVEEIFLPQTEIINKNKTIAQAIMLEDSLESFLAPNVDSPLQFWKAYKKDDIVYVYGTNIEKNPITGIDETWYYCTSEKSVCDYGFGWDMGCWVPAEKVDVYIPYGISTISFYKELVLKSEEKNSRFQFQKKIELSIMRGDKEFKTSVFCYKTENQDLYSFTWNDIDSGFHYSDPVGTFTYNPETKEIRHVSTIGPLEGMYSFLSSNDGKYIFGFSQGAIFKGLKVFDAKKGNTVMSSLFAGDFNYDGNNIECGHSMGLNDDKTEGNKEYFEYADSFRKENPPTEEQLSWGRQCRIYIKFRFDLNTLEKTFIGCEYIRDTSWW